MFQEATDKDRLIQYMMATDAAHRNSLIGPLMNWDTLWAGTSNVIGTILRVWDEFGLVPPM
jgi:hypothetical protein